MRGGRKDGKRGVSRSEGASAARAAFAMPIELNTGPDSGSQWNPQHVHTPLHSSFSPGKEGCALGCEEENATLTLGPSHRSQCGELRDSQATTTHTNHAIRRFAAPDVRVMRPSYRVLTDSTGA